MKLMNTANLQLEGLLLALSSLVSLLRQKGIASEEEICAVLKQAEAAALGDPARPGGVSAANVEAVLFPIRYLKAAAVNPLEHAVQPFSQVATHVGQTKRIPQPAG